MALVMSCPDTMPGFSHHEMDDVHAPASSEFGYAQTLMSSPTTGLFSSFSPSGPVDLHVSGWDSAVDGTQSFPDFQETAAADTFSHFSLGQVTSTPGEEVIEDFHGKWAMATTSQDATAAVPITSAPMRRMTSRSSAGSHKRGRASSKSRRRLRVTLAQASQMSYEHLTGSAAAMNDVRQYLDIESPAPVSAQVFYPGLTSATAAAYSPDVLAYGPMSHALAQQHVNPTCTQMDFEPGLTCHSPSQSWDSASSAGLARTPSPAAVDEAWIAPQMVSSPTDTSSCSPIFHSQSPRLSRKYNHLPLDGSINGLQASGFPEEFSLPPALAATRISNETESPRDHEWYKAVPKADGLYHCPLEGQENCNHKPEKLKCNYDKFVDSHLRPYRCKQEACENLQFSSTACLLRHEREAHGMHGHGAKPFMCTYDGCDRAQPGNGFPRHWNLKDHMKRVHNDVAPSQSCYTGGGSVSPSSAGPVVSGNQQQPQQPQQQPQQQAAKNRKRRKDEPASAGVRKSASSTAASSRPAASKADRRLAEAADRWFEHHQRLTELVANLAQPDDALQRLRDAQDQLAAMAKISVGLGPKKTPARA